MTVSHSPHAPTSISKPVPVGYCDECGFRWPLHKLDYQQIWAGPTLVRTGFRRCPSCMDLPNPSGKKPIRFYPDPKPLRDPRPGYLAYQQQFNAGFTTESGTQRTGESGAQFVDEDSSDSSGLSGTFTLDQSALDGPDVLA